MHVLIIYAHPEPKSFNGALKDLAVTTLSAQAHTVEVSDLYAMNFNPVAGPGDVLNIEDQTRFDLLTERARAYEQGTLAPDIVAEQEKVLRADFIIMQAPMWWFSIPAILKGWIDRVFMRGFAYGGGDWYDTGRLKGRRAMLAMTTGSDDQKFSPTGLYGDIHERLYAIQSGSLYFTGLEVLPPFIAWAVEGADESRCSGYLEDYKQRLLALETTESIPFVSPGDYDENHKLKPGVTRRIAATHSA